jgi:dienelactone hydrolase
MSENIFNGKEYYRCPMTDGDNYRKEYLDSVDAFIEKGLSEAIGKRAEFCSPEAMATDREAYREKYLSMIGSPDYPDNIPTAEREFVARDEFCSIYRLSIEVMDGFRFYGMLMIPNGVTRAPLVIAQHGGGGTPEKCSDMWGENNYGFFVKRALLRGKIVFAPQILVWSYKVADEKDAPPIGVVYGHRRDYDTRLKRLGLSLTGLEVFCIRRSVDYLSTLDCVDGERIGMMGLSYGGYFTLYTMAADTRIRAGYGAGFFNDRAHECFNDWGYFGSAHTFQDAEVAGLCAPRLLILDVGKSDPVFDYRHSVAEAERARAYYDAAGAGERFNYHLWEGGHRFDVESDGFERFFAELEK